MTQRATSCLRCLKRRKKRTVEVLQPLQKAKFSSQLQFLVAVKNPVFVISSQFVYMFLDIIGHFILNRIKCLPFLIKHFQQKKLVFLLMMYFLVRAVPFKYTWEGGNTTYFRPPHQQKKKIPPTTTRIYFNKVPHYHQKKNHKNNFLYRNNQSLALMIYQYTACLNLSLKLCM